MSEAKITVEPVDEAAFAGAEELLERLDHAEDALLNLVRLAERDDVELVRGEEWSARVTVDGTSLLVRSARGRWTIYGAPDDTDAMLAARKLHGLVGVESEGWDLDR